MRIRHFVKAVQRRTYDILSNKKTLFFFTGLFIVLPITTLLVLEKILWIFNANQSYVLVKSDFGGLMVDTSGSMKICENEPAIDVVYTWVNGSDAQFLRNLLLVKRDYLKTYGTDEVNCSIPLDCGIRSSKDNRLVYMDTSLVAIDISVDIGALEMFNNKRYELVKSQPYENYYYLVHLSEDEKRTLVNYFKLQNTENNPVKPIYVRIACSNYSLSDVKPNLAESLISGNIIYLSSKLSSQPLPSESTLSSEMSIFSLAYQWLPSRKQFLKLFNDQEKVQIRNIIYHSSRSSALILLEPVRDHDSLINHLKLIGRRFNFTVSTMFNLHVGEEDLIECTDGKMSEPLSINRFADNDELKYSLRSVEKFAPWIRNIYLVTNGQIPSWLNVDNPKISLITHEDIFPNKTDLPTFNSVAIECHLHRIPGLSENFLYFNDDILLGKPVYKEDFYSPTNGYKIYLAWPVPNCDPGCPTSWLADGFCDQACNTSLCLFDGGDCLNSTLSTNSHSNLSTFRGAPMHFSSHRPVSDQCRSSCADFWLGDQYCDNICNHPDCAFDMGDCGLEGYSNIPGQMFQVDQYDYLYPSPTISIYLNLTDLMMNPNFVLTRASYSKDIRVRMVTLNLKQRILTILFAVNVTDINIQIDLTYEIGEIAYDLNLNLNVTDKYNISTWKMFESKRKLIKSTPRPPTTTQSDDDNYVTFFSVNSTAPIEPVIIFDLKKFNYEQILGRLIKFKDELSSKGFNEDLNNLTMSILANKYEERPIGSYPWENVATFKRLGQLIANFEKYSTIDASRSTQRQLLDIFVDSIKYVNHIYNQVFGVKARRIIAHSPLFLNKATIQRLWNQFPNELSATSSHKLRSSNDMQFSFSYFNFLMSETSPVNLIEVVQKFDTDDSGGLSVNELRSLIANLAKPKIGSDVWSNYSNCWNGSDIDYLKHVGFELSIEKVLNCKEIESKLRNKFSSIPRNRFTVLSDTDVSFIMIRSNYVQSINSLDHLRREPRKFLCFNDDIHNEDTNGTMLTRSALKDYYQYLVPKRSSFELSQGEVCKFRNVSSYRQWKKSRINLINAVNGKNSSTWFYFLLCGTLLFCIIFKVLIFISNRSIQRSGNIETLRI